MKKYLSEIIVSSLLLGLCYAVVVETENSNNRLRQSFNKAVGNK